MVTATFRPAMARHGQPEAVRADRGGAFVAYTKDGDCGRVLEAELVEHIVGRSYSPRGGGKVESAIGTLKRELWECHVLARIDAISRGTIAAFAARNGGLGVTARGKRDGSRGSAAALCAMELTCTGGACTTNP